VTFVVQAACRRCGIEPAGAHRLPTQTINRIHRLLLELRDKPGDTAAIENRHADTTQADRGVRVPLNVTRPNFAAGLSSAFPGVMRVGQPLGSPHWPGPRLVGRPAANAQTRLPDSDAAGPKAS
jgi:hypothetical protein